MSAVETIKTKAEELIARLGLEWSYDRDQLVQDFLDGNEETLRVCTEYHVQMRENGYCPVVDSEEFGEVTELDAETKKKVLELHTGIAEVWITINRGNFYMTAGVVVTYDIKPDYEFLFDNTRLMCHLTHFGELPQPLEELVDAIVRYYEKHSRLIQYTYGEYDIRKMLLRAVNDPTSKKRARLE